jgi:predicted GNAT family acetyltransferase
MRKLKERERKALLEYLSQEPEINTFFIGVVENYSLESDEVTVYVEENTGWNVAILKFCENFIIYSQLENFDFLAVVDFLKAEIVDSVNGKASIIRQIAPYFPQMEMEEKAVLCLERCHEAPRERNRAKIRLLTPADTKKIVKLYHKNKELLRRPTTEMERQISERRAGKMGESIAVGLIYHQKLVSVAEIFSDNEITGLVVGIVTHPRYYGRGFAAQALSALCDEALRRGKKCVCILHDFPASTKLLKSVGFEEKSHYTLLH